MQSCSIPRCTASIYFYVHIRLSYHLVFAANAMFCKPACKAYRYIPLLLLDLVAVAASEALDCGRLEGGPPEGLVSGWRLWEPSLPNTSLMSASFVTAAGQMLYIHCQVY